MKRTNVLFDGVKERVKTYMKYNDKTLFPCSFVKKKWIDLFRFNVSNKKIKTELLKSYSLKKYEKYKF